MRESTYAVNRARSKAKQARNEAANTQSVADALDRAADTALGLFEQAVRTDEQENMTEEGCLHVANCPNTTLCPSRSRRT